MIQITALPDFRTAIVHRHNRTPNDHFRCETLIDKHHISAMQKLHSYKINYLYYAKFSYLTRIGENPLSTPSFFVAVSNLHLAGDGWAGQIKRPKPCHSSGGFQVGNSLQSSSVAGKCILFIPNFTGNSSFLDISRSFMLRE